MLGLGLGLHNSEFSPKFNFADFGSMVMRFDASNTASVRKGANPASDGDSVDGWLDISGNDRDLSNTSSGQFPIYESSDGYYVSFDGVNDKVFTTVGVGEVGHASSTEPCTIFFVGNPTTVANQDYWFGAEDNNKSFFRVDSSSSVSLKTYNGSAAQTLSVTSLNLSAGLKVYSISINSDRKLELTENLGSTKVSSTAFNSGYKAFVGTIGSSGALGSNASFPGDIYEFIYYEDYQGKPGTSGSNASLIVSELMSKHGVS